MDTTDETVALSDEATTEEVGQEYGGLSGYIKAKFVRAEDARLFDESRWLRAYRNYRGIYGSDMTFTEREKSRVFVKITKTKVLAAFGQLIEVLFANAKFPLGITPTKMPDGISERAYVEDGEATPEEPLPRPAPTPL